MHHIHDLSAATITINPAVDSNTSHGDSEGAKPSQETVQADATCMLRKTNRLHIFGSWV